MPRTKNPPTLPPLPMRARLSAPLSSGGVNVGMLWSMENPCNGDVIVDVLPVARGDSDKPFVTLTDLLHLAQREAKTYRDRHDERATELADLWAQRIESFVLQFEFYREKKEANAA